MIPTEIKVIFFFPIPKGVFLGWSFPRTRGVFGKGASVWEPGSPSSLWYTLSSISLVFSLSHARERAWMGWPVVTGGLRRVEGV